MTLEQRTFVEPKDIAAIEFQCSHCQMLFTYSIDTLDRMPRVCMNCMEPMLKEKSDEEAALRYFVTAVRGLRLFPFRTRIEVRT